MVPIRRSGAGVQPIRPHEASKPQAADAQDLAPANTVAEAHPSAADRKHRPPILARHHPRLAEICQVYSLLPFLQPLADGITEGALNGRSLASLVMLAIRRERDQFEWNQPRKKGFAGWEATCEPEFSG